MKTKSLTLLRLLALGAALAGVAALEARADSHVQVGVSIGVPVPQGYAQIRVGRDHYYWHRGVFYRPTRHGYIVCPAPRGAIVRVLPPYSVRFHFGNVWYYRFGDVWYRPVSSGYEVVEAPVGNLPPPAPAETYQSVWVDQHEFLFRDGQFFQRTPEGVVWTPAPLGALTKTLPSDAQSVWYHDVEYFDSDGVIFRKTPEGYRVTEAPWKK